MHNPQGLHDRLLLLLLLISVLVCMPWLLPGSDSEDGQLGRYHEAYMVVEDLSDSHYQDDLPQRLRTPQGLVEFLLNMAEKDRFERAALALDLSRLEEGPRSERGAELARRLHYLLLQRGLVDWQTLPDRADGQAYQGLPTGDRPAAGEPRRSIRIGVIEGRERTYPINIHRMKQADRPAIWLFSADTVENLDPLYELYGPGWLEQRLPSWARERGPWGSHVWEWVALAIFFILSLGVGWLVLWVLDRGSRMRSAQKLWMDELLHHLRWPGAVLSTVVLFYILSRGLLSLTGPLNNKVDIVLVLLVIVTATWVATRIIRYATDRYARDLERRVEEEDDSSLRKTITAISVFRRVLSFVAVVIALGIILQELQLFRTIGISLLASAGAAGALLALAGGPVIGNLIAGLQVALTRPVDIGDTVVVEDHYGWVEQITYTYLVVRTWQQHRLIVPLRHFVQTPFQNLTKHDKFIIRPVILHVDYRIDVQTVRERFAEVVRNHEDWDENMEPKLVVRDMGEDSVVVQGYASAKDPSTSWFMHCDVREQMIAFIRDLESGLYLPRERVQHIRNPIEEDDPEKADDADAALDEDEQGEKDRAAAG
ncbi:MAG: mechanosensitive ion channel family protein [Planctomycetota bacterium]